jgi:hypothetical protein
MEEIKSKENSSKTKNFTDIIKKEAAQFCCETSAHGLGNIVSSEHYVYKFLWVFIVLAGIATTAYCNYFNRVLFKKKIIIKNKYLISVITAALIVYYQYGVSVSISTNFESTTQFPAVTLCNLIPFDLNSNTNFFMSMIQNASLTPNITPTLSSPGIYQVQQTMNFLRANILANSQTYNSTFLKSLGFDLNSMLISCYFNKERCTASDFTWIFSFEYGNCYSFNYKRNSSINLKTISNAGPSFGLVMGKQ